MKFVVPTSVHVFDRMSNSLSYPIKSRPKTFTARKADTRADEVHCTFVLVSRGKILERVEIS